MSYHYAGLERVHAPGLSVAEAARRLSRIACVEQRLMRPFAARIVTIPERDLKMLMGRLQFEASVHASGLRDRLLELRTSKGKLEQVPDLALKRLFDEAERLPGTYPFVAVALGLLKPALRDAYQRYLSETNDLADYGSARLIQQHLHDEAERLRLLELALADLPALPAARETGAAQTHALSSFLAAAGGIDGTLPRGELPPRVSDAAPAEVPSHPPHPLARDETFRRVWDFVKPPLDAVETHLNYIMSIRLREVNVAEGLALILCEQPDMPWSFHADISRHCWDEMRHSLFGGSSRFAWGIIHRP